jgi:hypothetical protein
MHYLVLYLFNLLASVEDVKALYSGVYPNIEAILPICVTRGLPIQAPVMVRMGFISPRSRHEL